MKTATEYRNELYALVDAMDDETFEAWMDAFSPDRRMAMGSIYVARYDVLKARQIVELVKAQRETPPRVFLGVLKESPNRS